MTTLADAIRVLPQIATIVGIGVAIVVFMNEKRMERERGRASTAPAAC
jgi:hypothetical protein